MDPEFAFVPFPIPSPISLCSIASFSHAFVIPLCSLIIIHGQTGAYMVHAHGLCVGRLVYILQYLPCILLSFDILVRLSTVVGFLQHPHQPGYSSISTLALCLCYLLVNAQLGASS
jgi:hypothetical protein